ncbi:AAC(3) family N-acetyltransferase [bacterium]|nr:AAC(3) family N-acetyltransferase [bacterium]
MLTQPSLGEVFRGVGLQEGDSVIVHSSYRSLGEVAGGPATVIEALLDVIGPTGNLMLPTFNYTDPLPEPFYDVDQTACRTGIIPELGRRRPDAVRSLHPTHSVAVVGPDARALTDGHLETRAFGVGSPIDRLAGRGGKILLLGVGQTANSMIHVAEEHAGIPKVSAYDPLPLVTVRLPGDPSRFVRHRLDSSCSCSAAFEAAAAVLRRHHAIRDGRTGNCLLQLMNGRTLIDLLVAQLTPDPTALLCSNPDCVPCGGTRRAIGLRPPLSVDSSPPAHPPQSTG